MNLDLKKFFLNNLLLFVFFFICIVGTLTSEYFFTLTNLQNMVRNMAVPGLLALGVSFVFLVSRIDLSVGSLTIFGPILAVSSLAFFGDIFDFKKVFMKLETDVLEIVFEDLENPDGSYDFLINTNNTLTYKKCDNTPASVTLLFGEVLTYMNSKASLSCSNFSSNKANCFEDMFNFLDVSGNKALSNAEINRASKLLVFFSAVNGQEFNEAGVFGVMSSYAITPLLTKVILNNFDFDNSSDLKLEEILQDRESLFNLDFSNNDQIEIDNQKINNQIKEFINKLQGLGSFL